MKLTLPTFCTTVSPTEYDYIEQFNQSIKAANKFHQKLTIDENCPPPYFPLDVGKVHGLITHIAALEARLKEAEEVIKPFADEPIMPEFDDDLYKETQIQVIHFRRAAAWLKGGHG